MMIILKCRRSFQTIGEGKRYSAFALFKVLLFASFVENRAGKRTHLLLLFYATQLFYMHKQVQYSVALEGAGAMCCRINLKHPKRIIVNSSK